MKIIRPRISGAGAPKDLLTIGLAQIAPVWLDRSATLEKVCQSIEQAAAQGCDLITFGEALVPGYPFWVERTGGAAFNDQRQKEFYSLYLDEGVVLERGDLDAVCGLAKQHELAVYLGIMERAPDRGGHTLYATLVYIDQAGEIRSAHRKLQPTYEERLVWGAGDGHGLRTHPLGAFTVGGLNCWENWLPLARASLYGQGEDLHISVWPGGLHNTKDLPLFIAKESRSYVIAVSGFMSAADVPADFPHFEEILSDGAEFLANGGSCIAGPDGEWIVEPVIGEETLIIAQIDHARVREERQNLDVAGHYSRPDITQLRVNRRRQSTVEFDEDD